MLQHLLYYAARVVRHADGVSFLLVVLLDGKVKLLLLANDMRHAHLPVVAGHADI